MGLCGPRAGGGGEPLQAAVREGHGMRVKSPFRKSHPATQCEREGRDVASGQGARGKQRGRQGWRWKQGHIRGRA